MAAICLSAHDATTLRMQDNKHSTHHLALPRAVYIRRRSTLDKQRTAHATQVEVSEQLKVLKKRAISNSHQALTSRLRRADCQHITIFSQSHRGLHGMPNGVRNSFCMPPDMTTVPAGQFSTVEVASMSLTPIDTSWHRSGYVGAATVAAVLLASGEAAVDFFFCFFSFWLLLLVLLDVFR